MADFGHEVGNSSIVEPGEPTTLDLKQILGTSPDAEVRLEADLEAISAAEVAAYHKTRHIRLGYSVLGGV